jgi:hypothetical protein
VLLLLLLMLLGPGARCCGCAAHLLQAPRCCPQQLLLLLPQLPPRCFLRWVLLLGLRPRLRCNQVAPLLVLVLGLLLMGPRPGASHCRCWHGLGPGCCQQETRKGHAPRQTEPGP